jgi:hypothetical protein
MSADVLALALGALALDRREHSSGIRVIARSACRHPVA